jgi:hypothetical protein
LEFYFGEDVTRIGRKLATVFDRNQTPEAKAAAVMELRKNTLFRQTGTGFLASFVPADVLANFMRFDISMDSSETASVFYEFGNFLESPVYRRILYIQTVLNKDNLDIRLEAEGYKIREIRNGRP